MTLKKSTNQNGIYHSQSFTIHLRYNIGQKIYNYEKIQHLDLDLKLKVTLQFFMKKDKLQGSIFFFQDSLQLLYSNSPLLYFHYKFMVYYKCLNHSFLFYMIIQSIFQLLADIQKFQIKIKMVDELSTKGRYF